MRRVDPPGGGVATDESALSRDASAVGLLFLLIVVVLLLGSALILNGGKLIYALDDAYIHLALAENIVRGTYGVNLGEFSTPSSSIIWPFLLAPLARTPVATVLPLVFNAAAAMLSVYLVARLSAEVLAPRTLRVCLPPVLLFVIVAHLPWLVLSGMEHTLQVLLSVATIYGLTRSEAQAPPRWLWLAIGAAPLVRYECLALSLPALLLLARRGHVRLAVQTALVMLATLAIFSLFLWAGSGEQWLPSSVEAKALVTRAGLSRVVAVWIGVENNLATWHGRVLAAGAVALGILAVRARAGMAAVAAIAVVGHLLGGIIDEQGRYVAYCYAILFTAALYTLRVPLGRVLQHPGSSLALVAVILAVVYPTVRTTYLAPLATNDIFRQHYQLHRLVTRYVRAPVAVNDLGWVSFRNDEYVLDFYGLGNRASLVNRLAGTDPAWMEEAAARHGVSLVMIYDEWFREIPSWTLVGRLYLGRARVTAGASTVSIYSRGAPDPAIRDLLAAFARSLPTGAPDGGSMRTPAG